MSLSRSFVLSGVTIPDISFNKMVTSFSQYVLNNGDRLPALARLFERPLIVFLPDGTALSHETRPLPAAVSLVLR